MRHYLCIALQESTKKGLSGLTKNNIMSDLFGQVLCLLVR